MTNFVKWFHCNHCNQFFYRVITFWARHWPRSDGRLRLGHWCPSRRYCCYGNRWWCPRDWTRSTCRVCWNPPAGKMEGANDERKRMNDGMNKRRNNRSWKKKLSKLGEVKCQVTISTCRACWNPPAGEMEGANDERKGMNDRLDKRNNGSRTKKLSNLEEVKCQVTVCFAEINLQSNRN